MNSEVRFLNIEEINVPRELYGTRAALFLLLREVDKWIPRSEYASFDAKGQNSNSGETIPFPQIVKSPQKTVTIVADEFVFQSAAARYVPPK